MIDAVVLAGLIVAAIALRAGRRLARNAPRALSWFETAQKYGDPIHAAYGTFAALVGVAGVKAGTAGLGYVFLSLGLAAIYVAYQIADWLKNKDEVDKDLAVFAGAYAITLSMKLGIPLFS